MGNLFQWNNPESPDSVFSHRIKVVYLPPEGQTVPEEDEGPSGDIQSHELQGVPSVADGKQAQPSDSVSLAILSQSLRIADACIQLPSDSKPSVGHHPQVRMATLEI